MMASWVLILTINVANSFGQIQVIEGFKDKAECVAAGEAWKKSMPTTNTSGGFACVARS